MWYWDCYWDYWLGGLGLPIACVFVCGGVVMALNNGWTGVERLALLCGGILWAAFTLLFPAILCFAICMAVVRWLLYPMAAWLVFDMEPDHE